MMTRETLTEQADHQQRGVVVGAILGTVALAALAISIFGAAAWVSVMLTVEALLIAAGVVYLQRRVNSLRRQAAAAPTRKDLEQKKPPYRWFFEGCRTLAEVDERVRALMDDYIASTTPWNAEAGERWARDAWKAARPTEGDLAILLANDPSILQVRFADLTTDEANKFEVGVDGAERIIGTGWSGRLLQTVANLAQVHAWKAFARGPKLTDDMRAVLAGERSPVSWVDVVAESKDDVAAHARIARSWSSVEGTFATPIDEFMRQLLLFVVEQRVRFMLDREGLTTLAAAGDARKQQLELDRENQRRQQVEFTRASAAAAVATLAAER